MYHIFTIWTATNILYIILIFNEIFTALVWVHLIMKLKKIVFVFCEDHKQGIHLIFFSWISR